MSKDNELVLVLPSQLAVPEPWYGLKTAGLAEFEKLVRDNCSFRKRGEVEDDLEWKQIIPYLIFRFRDRYFLMQRSDQADNRLINKYSLGIGGHINKEDLKGKTITDWAEREFKEEVDCLGLYQTKPLGLLNDDTNKVGQVHLGYVILLEGDSDRLSIRDEHKFGGFSTLEDIQTVYNQMETWSQIIFHHLKNYPSSTIKGNK